MRRLIFVAALAVAPSPQASADPRTDYRPALNECIAAANGSAIALNACRGVVSARCASEENEASFTAVLCISDEAQAWEEVMDGVLARLRANGEPETASTLDAAQSYWLEYREMECGYRHTRFGVGSGAQYLLAECMADITAVRAIDLLLYEPVAD